MPPSLLSRPPPHAQQQPFLYLFSWQFIIPCYTMYLLCLIRHFTINWLAVRWLKGHLDFLTKACLLSFWNDGTKVFDGWILIYGSLDFLLVMKEKDRQSNKHVQIFMLLHTLFSLLIPYQIAFASSDRIWRCRTCGCSKIDVGMSLEKMDSSTGGMLYSWYIKLSTVLDDDFHYLLKNYWWWFSMSVTSWCSDKTQ